MLISQLLLLMVHWYLFSNSFVASISVDFPVFHCGNDCLCTTYMGSKISAECSNQQLIMVPTDLPKEIEKLDLSNNNINLEAYEEGLICQMYPNLSTVSFAENKMKQLYPIFSGCDKLTEMNLQNNNIQNLNPDTLKGLNNLEVLLGLELKELKVDSLRELHQLKHLQLTYHGKLLPSLQSLSTLNKLELTLPNMIRLSAESFQVENSSLMELKLKAPKLKLLPSTLLKMLVNLVDLELEFTKLNDLHFENTPKKIKSLKLKGVRATHTDLLQGMDSLERLWLQNMDIIRFNMYGNTLKELLLADCSLEKMPPKWLINLTNLEILNITTSGLQYIDPLDFVNLSSLKLLVLSGNKLSSFPALAVRHLSHTLQKLIVSKSPLDTLLEGHVSNMLALEVIDFSENKIEVIGENAFHNLPQLKRLYLQQNFLEKLPTKFLANIPKLAVLNLAGNSFYTWPTTLLTTDVDELDMSSNMLTKLPWEKMCTMKNYTVLKLFSNLLLCDCALRELLYCRPPKTIHATCSISLHDEPMNINEYTGCITTTTTSSSTESTTAASTLSSTTPSTLSSTESTTVGSYSTKSTSTETVVLAVEKAEEVEIVRPIVISDNTGSEVRDTTTQVTSTTKSTRSTVERSTVEPSQNASIQTHVSHESTTIAGFVKNRTLAYPFENVTGQKEHHKLEMIKQMAAPNSQSQSMLTLNSLIIAFAVIGTLTAVAGIGVWCYRKVWQTGSYDTATYTDPLSLNHRGTT
ncbi:leucine-rich repeat-containing G-protein coupled receptor 6-like [Physella acuta]|uniref:leucine-rich repeat-containing G-protein coupled receptor 6-like n=1 Tax=Physella acuta TaxID=109671 RepID=UPI0027DC8281|nr:leucine-rich repeat-containing G-protein coupled receptor 6-like [Physella acuta]XP_059153837.1 leucine-rich repeat-containing G-protein coupled receptor 6-like [Physella acuta]